MAQRKQLLDRIDHGDAKAFGHKHGFHNGDREFFATADDGGVDAVRALAQQADAVQNCLS